MNVQSAGFQHYEEYGAVFAKGCLLGCYQNGMKPFSAKYLCFFYLES
jgi:hypothetical protein